MYKLTKVIIGWGRTKTCTFREVVEKKVLRLRLNLMCNQDLSLFFECSTYCLSVLNLESTKNLVISVPGFVEFALKILYKHFPGSNVQFKR